MRAGNDARVASYSQDECTIERKGFLKECMFVQPRD